jgi:WD40 repeat protein
MRVAGSSPAAQIVTGIAPEERFLAFSADGHTFLSWDRKQSRAWLRTTNGGQKPAALRTSEPVLDVLTAVFSDASGWRYDAARGFIGTWKNGMEIVAAQDRVELVTPDERWLLRDPRDVPAPGNARWKIEEQELIALSPSARVFVTRSGSLIRLWDAATAGPLSPWLSHESGVVAVAFSTDGWLWTLSMRGYVRRYPADTTVVDDAGWVDDLGEAVSGTRLDDRSEVTALPEPDLVRARRRLRETIESATKRGDPVAAWFLRRLL